MQYSSTREAQQAVELFNDRYIGHLKLFARPDKDTQPPDTARASKFQEFDRTPVTNNKVFIQNLSYSVDLQTLTAFMEKAGNVVDAKLHYKENGTPKGYQ